MNQPGDERLEDRLRWQPRLLPLVLESRAQQQASTVALRFLEDGVRETVTWTYGEVFDRALAVGAALRRQAQVGDRVLLIYPPGLDFVVAFCACLLSGLVAVPCPPPGARSRATGRLAAIARDAQARLLATTEGLSAGLQAQAALGEDWTCLTTDGLGATPGQPENSTADSERHQPRAEDLAFLQYTSGSTGKPKGVMVTQGQLAANLEALRLTFSLTADDVSVTWLPSFHDMGLVDGVLEPLYAGCMGVVMPPVAFLMNPRCWLQAMSHYGGTHGGGPSFGYDLLLQRMKAEDWQALDLSRWRSAYNGAEPVRFEVIERFSREAAQAGFRAEAMVPCYGMAEATLMVTCSRVGRAPQVLWVQAAALEQDRLVRSKALSEGARALVGCGAAEWGTEVVIADAQTGTALPEGQVGEVWARGPAIAQGYWGQDEQTTAAFGARLADGRGPYLRTGDLGALVGGELFVTGRIKDLIILQGRNHYPQDLEACAEAAHPALRSSNSAAFSVPGPEGEDLVLVMEVQRSARHGLEVEAVAAAVRAAVAELHGAVVECVTLIAPGSLPKTSSGKIQRRACRQAWLQTSAAGRSARTDNTEKPEATGHDGGLKVLGHSVRRGEPDAPAAQAIDLQTRLLELAAQVLQVRPSLIDPQQPLSRAGLDSLRAVRLAGDIGRLLGRTVPPTLLYDHPTLAGLAQALAGASGRSKAALMPPATTGAGSTQGPVAIVGLGCRVPGARGAEGLWRLLSRGTDAVVPMADRRWPADTLRALGIEHLRAGLVDGLDTLDDTLFGLSPAEAQMMDPQQRLLLEVSWEALEHAQVAPASWAGRPVGVFVGISAQDWSRVTAPLGGPTHLFHGTGSALSIAANRLSYFYDFQGPSVAVDTACSSSLMALHMACRALEQGECETALVGGVNALLDPSMSQAFASAGMLSPQGRCATFDQAADGYVRGEGCIVLVLKPLARAQAEGDRILAVVRGTATNQDGRSQGLTAPNGPAQQAVVRAALQRAGAEPGQVAYVEAHGTGTALGDPIEAQALQQVFGPRREPSQPLWVGSVKTQVGHLEAAAGLMGVAKTVLCLHHRTITPNLHWHQPNALAPIGPGRLLQVPTAPQVWPEGPASCAGVSSFGFGGANVHAVLGPAPQEAAAREVPAVSPPLSMPLMLSAATPAALDRLASQWAAHLEAADDPEPCGRWAEACAVAAHGRAVLPYRLALWAAPADARAGAQRLRRWAADAGRGREPAGRPRVAWLFTGQGSVSSGMGLPFVDEPAFQSGLGEVAVWLEPALPQPLAWLLTQAPTEELTPTAVAQPLLFAFEWALARWWQAQGVSPAVVMGHSLGEITAAAVGGWITLESAAAFVVERGRIMAALNGRMVAVAAAREPVLAVLASWARKSPEAVASAWGLAADNGPQETVLSGPEEGLAALRAALADAGLTTTLLNTPHGFHSAALEPLLPALGRAAAQLRFTTPTVPLMRSGPALDAASPAYWVAQAREPVHFRAAVQEAQAAGVEVWLELGPRPVLSGLVQQIAGEDGEAAPPAHAHREAARPPVVVASARAGTAAGMDILPHHAALSTLWACGALPTESLAARVPRVRPADIQGLDLPTYPFERTRHWPAGLAACGPAACGDAPLQDPAAECAPFVRMVYRPVAPPAIEAPRSVAATVCVLVGRASARRSAWAADLEQQGVRVRAVAASWEDSNQELLAALREAQATAPARPLSVVLLLAPDAQTQAAGTAVADAQALGAVRAAYAQVLVAAQALLEHKSELQTTAAARVDSSLHGAQLHVVAEGLSEPAKEAAAAVLRVLAVEEPDVAGHFIASPAADHAPTEVAALCVAPGPVARREWRVDARGWAERGTAVQPRGPAAAQQGKAENENLEPSRNSSPVGWQGAGVLVVGGMGGVGRHLVNALAKRGVAHLWLVGRRVPSAAELLAWQTELAGGGVTIEAWSIDLEDPVQRQSLRDRLLASPTPLSDVIYAAGRTADAPLPQQTLAAFDELGRLQLQGPMALRQMLDDLPWRRFIVAGSAAGLVGSAAQAPYAAAHAALAAWARAEDETARAASRPQAGDASHGAARRVLSLAWGPWRGTGLAASSAVDQAMQRQGVRLLNPQDASEALFELVEQGWSDAGLFHPPAKPSHRASSEPSMAVPDSSARNQWQQARTGERRACALALLLEDARAVLGHPPGHRLDLHRGFFEIGFDSLSLVALRQRVQARWVLSLPTTVAFEYPCLGDLAEHLHEMLQAQEQRAHTTGDPELKATKLEAKLAGAPVAEAADDALARELAAIEKLLS